jgi:hypothetical protein
VYVGAAAREKDYGTGEYPNWPRGANLDIIHRENAGKFHVQVNMAPRRQKTAAAEHRTARKRMPAS